MSESELPANIQNTIFHQKLSQFGRLHRNLFNIESPLIVGVSGGVDSLSLIHWLAHSGLRSRQMPLIAVTLDHGLRANSRQEAEQVARIVSAWGVQTRVESLPVHATIERLKQQNARQSTSIETIGRQLRYEALANIAKEHGSHLAAVAHHADDQAESILMHLLRGSGLNGLVGMTPLSSWPLPNDDDLKLIRPMLNIWKAEIEQYADQCGLSPVIDQSNFDLSFTRNRIRQTVIPALMEEAPEIKQQLVQLGQIAHADLELVNEQHGLAWTETITKEHKQWVRGRLDNWRSLSLSSQRGLLRRAVQQVGNPQETISFAQIERLVDLFKQQSSGKQTADNSHYVAYAFANDFIIGAKGIDPAAAFDAPQLPSALDHHALGLDMSNPNWHLDIASGWTLQSMPHETVNPAPEAWITSWQTTLPLSLLESGEPLVLRTRQPGDIIYFADPSAQIHKIKLKSFWINAKIPKPLRDRWPLLTIGSTVLWVVGLRSGLYPSAQPPHLALHLVFDQAGNTYGSKEFHS